MSTKKTVAVLLSLVLVYGMYSWMRDFFWSQDSHTLWVRQNLSCSSEFSHLYSRKAPVEVRIVFGYKDARPARFVGDRYEKNYVLQKLMELGFDRDPANDDKFQWRQKMGEEERRLQLMVVHSSVGPDDVENRRNPLQKWRSAYAKSSYMEGLRSADVVIYVGHSRAGGGPDFSPPVCLKNGAVNYSWYHRKQPGFKETVAALKKSGDDPKMLYLLSCASTRHFKKGLQKAAPNTEIVSSESLLYYMDSLDNLVKVLRNMVSPPCEQSSNG